MLSPHQRVHFTYKGEYTGSIMRKLASNVHLHEMKILKIFTFIFKYIRYERKSHMKRGKEPSVFQACRRTSCLVRNPRDGVKNADNEMIYQRLFNWTDSFPLSVVGSPHATLSRYRKTLLQAEVNSRWRKWKSFLFPPITHLDLETTRDQQRNSEWNQMVTDGVKQRHGFVNLECSTSCYRVHVCAELDWVSPPKGIWALNCVVWWSHTFQERSISRLVSLCMSPNY